MAETRINRNREFSEITLILVSLWAGNAACTGEMRNDRKKVMEQITWRTGVDGRMILKQILHNVV
jgi:hypothetical protein